jgi:hypothetical protein
MALAVQVASPWTRRYVKLVASPKVARPAKWQKHCKPWC